MGKYDDMIDLPRPISMKHRPMPMSDRAAQFAPFAALSGYEDAIGEAARLTDEQLSLGEDEQSELNEKLRLLIANAEAHPEVTVTYFQPDRKKKGGSYVSKTGAFKRVHADVQMIEFTDGTRIALSSILDMEAELFSDIKIGGA